MAALQRHYVYTGEGSPPEDATHVSIHESITVIPARLFSTHPNIVELICHDDLRKIEEFAFFRCIRLKRLVMPGVEDVGCGAFQNCAAVSHFDSPKREKIGRCALSDCTSLESIDLLSAKFVEKDAFYRCAPLKDAKFGKSLESIGEDAFSDTALNRITIPLKRGLFTHDDVFVGCKHLDQVSLIEEAIIDETVKALLLDDWKNDMKEEIDSINQTLPDIYAGYLLHDEDGSANVYGGEKTRTIREWIGRVLQKLIRYKVEHYRLLSLAAAALAHASPNGVVIESTLSFLQLPDHVFEGEGVNSATTPAFDRQLWENVVEMEQRAIERDSTIRQLGPKVAKHGQEVAEAGEATAHEHEGSFDPSRKRPRTMNC